MPSISTSTVSPGFSQRGGVLAWPTPGGVPSAIRSPGASVVYSEMMAMVFAAPQIMFPVLELCRISSPTRLSIFSPAAPSGSSSGVTTMGPIAPVSSKFLPGVH